MSGKPPLIRGQVIRLVGPAVGLVLGLVVLIIVQLSIGGGDQPITLLIVAGVAAVAVAASVAGGLLLGRRAFGQRLEIALRPTGETRWRHGYIEAADGRMRFHRYKAQIRFATGTPIDYVIEQVGVMSERRPSRRQLLSVNPALRIIDVVSDRGRLELGVQAHQIEDIRSRLTPDSGSTGRVQGP